MMTSLIQKSAALFLASALVSAAHAGAEFSPAGKGPVVVMTGGQTGPEHHIAEAKDLAAMGYEVILIDGNAVVGSKGQVLKDAIQQGLASPHALPGKVGMIGFSLGGGETLGWAAHWADQVAVVVVWYPATVLLAKPSDFARSIKVPVLMFAGEADTYRNCCRVETARAMAAAADAAGAPFTLVTYPGAKHGFTLSGPDYDATATADSWKRAKAELAQFLPR